jgi:hypothetical protein
MYCTGVQSHISTVAAGLAGVSVPNGQTKCRGVGGEPSEASDSIASSCLWARFANFSALMRASSR